MRRILLNDKYEHLREFICSLPERMNSEGEYVYGGRRNLIKKFTTEGGVQLSVKRYKKPNLISNIVYSSGIKKPKGLRAYTYPQILKEKNIDTPESIAYIEDRHYGLLGYSYFISLHCPYTHLLYEVGNAEEGTYEDLAKALAAFAAHMHENGVLHQDFSPGNILWERREEREERRENTIDSKLHTSSLTHPPSTFHHPPSSLLPPLSSYSFSIVDINRMKFGPVSMKEGAESFARLWGPKRFISILTREYARLRGFDADETEEITMQARARFWKKYMKKREMEFNLEL